MREREERDFEIRTDSKRLGRSISKAADQVPGAAATQNIVMYSALLDGFSPTKLLSASNSAFVAFLLSKSLLVFVNTFMRFTQDRTSCRQSNTCRAEIAISCTKVRIIVCGQVVPPSILVPLFLWSAFLCPASK